MENKSICDISNSVVDTDSPTSTRKLVLSYKKRISQVLIVPVFLVVCLHNFHSLVLESVALLATAGITPNTLSSRHSSFNVICLAKVM